MLFCAKRSAMPQPAVVTAPSPSYAWIGATWASCSPPVIRHFQNSKTYASGTRPTVAWGSFYRSKHELVFVFKVGNAPHTNTFGLGDTGRYRTNVWDYAGVNTRRPNRDEELAMHPTVKPAALVADAIKDCSRRGEIVLDPFARLGHHVDCGPQHRSPRTAYRARSRLLRPDRATLRAGHRQASHSCRYKAEL